MMNDDKEFRSHVDGCIDRHPELFPQGIRAWQKITCHFHIPSSGHLHPILNLKVLEIVHYSCGFELSDRTNLT